MKDYIKITCVGDIMCKAEMLDSCKTNDNQYSFDSIYEELKELFCDTDLLCGNLETPISPDNTNLVKKSSFNAPIEFVRAIHNAGFNFVSTANNHCLDRGLNGLNCTIDCLDREGLLHSGTFNNKDVRNQPLVVNVQGVNIGLMAYTYGTNAFANHLYLKRGYKWMVNLFQEQELSCKIDRYISYHSKDILPRLYKKICRLLNTPNASVNPWERKECSILQRIHLKKDIKRTQKSSDIVLLYMHAGGQLNESAKESTKALVRYLEKNGVNIIAGAHEHVVHGSDMSRISDNIVATYSLGNFVGVAGTLLPPFDKKAEYSIAWHIYIDKTSKSILKTSYSVCVAVKLYNSNGIKIMPLNDYISEIEDQNQKCKLEHDMKEIASRFSGQHVDTIEKEYLLAKNKV